MALKQIVIALSLWPMFCFTQHSIKCTFSPAGDYKAVLLYKVEPTFSNYVTNGKVNEEGKLEIKLDSTVTKGMYRIVYAIPQEEYNFDIIYNGKEDIELTFNNETGVEFISSTENKLLDAYTNSMLMITNSISNYYADQNEEKDTLALLSIFKTQRETQQNFEKASKGKIAEQFIKANRPYIPKHAISVENYITALKQHYFDYVDFNNKTLQCSKFLTERMLSYVFGMSSGSDNEFDVYKTNINTFYNKMGNISDELKKELIADLWEQMADLNLYKVANYISNAYLLPLAKKLNDKLLTDALTLYKNTSIGAVAPDFSFKVNLNDETSKKRLSELDDANHYIIVFWSSECSHCLEEIPELHSFNKILEDKKIKVIAIGLEEETTKWNELIKNLPYFKHVYGKGKWDNAIGNSYGVTSTPSYFILNSEKKIAAKPYDLQELKAFFKD